MTTVRVQGATKSFGGTIGAWTASIYEAGPGVTGLLGAERGGKDDSAADNRYRPGAGPGDRDPAGRDRRVPTTVRDP